MSDFLQQAPIVLASGSRARAELLRRLGLHFRVHCSEVDEDAIKQRLAQDSDPEFLAHALAVAKALAVSNEHPDQYIIAGDQLCVMDNRIFDKPGNHANAVLQLQTLAGREHWQYSAACLAYNGAILWQGIERARLRLRPLSLEAIEHYLASESPYQSCGSYHYENKGRWLFDQVEGSDACIQGLPLQSLCNALLAHGIVRF